MDPVLKIKGQMLKQVFIMENLFWKIRNVVRGSLMKYAAILFLTLILMHPGTAADDSVHVSVRKDADHIVLQADFSVPVSRDIAWDVLTDFQHMAEYLPYLSESAVLSHNGNNLQIRQKGAIPFLFLNVKFDSTKTVELIPDTEIQAKTTDAESGYMISVSKIVNNNNLTGIAYSADWRPASKLASEFGADKMQKIANEQLSALKKEMLRRALLKQGTVLTRNGSAGNR